jgi:hypothetical protein
MREAQLNRDAQVKQLTKEKEELEKSLEKKQERYKRKVKDVLQELEILTQRNIYLQKSHEEKNHDLKHIAARY